MHVAVATHLVFTDDGNVVFNVASRDTRAATGAGREVNGHAPAVSNVLDGVLVPQIEGLGRLSVLGIDGSILVNVFVNRELNELIPRRLAFLGVVLCEEARHVRFLHDAVTAHEGVLDLRARQWVGRSRGFNSHVELVISVEVA